MDEVSTYDFNLEPPITGVVTTGRASFVQLATSVTEPPTNFLGTLDVCTVGSDSTYQPSIAAGTGLDAGSAVTIKRADASTFSTLSKLGTGTYQGSSPATLPTGIQVTIPGADFPAVNAALTVASVPTAVSAQGFTQFEPPVGVGADLADNTVWKWATVALPAATSSAMVMVARGNLGGGNTVTVVCKARDDGEFALPAATIADLETRGLTTIRVASSGRFIVQTQTVGTGAYLVKVTSSQLKAP
ncbi:MAG: hypothetical protein SFU83_06720 [Meiothermus sp.]|nr:hypothetical protein [Meiothermus sp.]